MSNYPAGAAFDSRAPYNESRPNEERSFNIFISQTLSKTTEVSTSDYIIEVCEDEDGKCDYIDTSRTDWEAAYNENKMTPLDLIIAFKNLLNKVILDPNISSKDKKKYKFYIEECEDWVEDEITVMKD